MAKIRVNATHPHKNIRQVAVVISETEKEVVVKFADGLIMTFDKREVTFF